MSSYILEIPGIRALIRAIDVQVVKHKKKAYIGKLFYFRGSFKGTISDVIFNERLNLWDPYVIKAIQAVDKFDAAKVWYNPKALVVLESDFDGVYGYKAT